MAAVGTKTLLLELVMAALVVAAAQAAVTIYDPAGLMVNISEDSKKNVQVTTEMLTVDLTQAQEDIHFTVADGEVVDVHVQDGDVLVLIPDPTDPLNVQALKVQVGSLTEAPHPTFRCSPQT